MGNPLCPACRETVLEAVANEHLDGYGVDVNREYGDVVHDTAVEDVFNAVKVLPLAAPPAVGPELIARIESLQPMEHYHSCRDEEIGEGCSTTCQLLRDLLRRPRRESGAKMKTPLRIRATLGPYSRPSEVGTPKYRKRHKRQTHKRLRRLLAKEHP
jgi:hypothetical protein